ncbi:Spy/CpxP family protein refolding chaperone [Rhodoplanes sp. TEM]|uniref:Spy/CpxP family protein refolding chaperone n=1 Tax=Rhodoplanes tepidamans TaxID=200616 RepID=A0ABT5J637_RHOTP|nr:MULTISPECIES: Spy/CpxP family protein refolding chaperone [Rhodoplanes]MDC7785109.1 Spy/CpxP family protein refolding chaperone [Rhodoplanes tepidamans]MDC7982583.1 Spy/CpxP family protein refolding chaperone [Rhodoplanes sp. TEM]MDQ0356599.1 hypothetical protein [Rhodoplanes tepidamans]
MWKSLLAGTAMIALAGTGYGLAQQRPEGAPPPAQSAPAPSAPSGSASSLTDRQAYLEARIAALRAGLALTPEQDRAWPDFERAYRAFMADRVAAREAWRERMREDRAGGATTGDPLERLERFADQATRRAGSLKALADATAPLVKSLDDSQKRRFWSLARLGPRFADGGPHGRHPWRGDDRGRHGWHHDRGHHDRWHENRGSGPGRHGFHGPDRWRDGYGRGERWGHGPDRRDGPGWREGRRWDDDRRGSGPYRRDDDRRRPLGDGEERL